MDKKNKIKKILNVIMFLISASILGYFCIDNNNLLVLIGIFPELNFFWLIAAVLILLLSWFFDSLVLKDILSDMTNKKYGNFASFKLIMVGQFFGAISPLSIAGKPMQVLYLINQNFSAGSAASVFVRKFLIYQSSMSIYLAMIMILKSQMFSSKIPGFMLFSLIGLLSQCLIIFVFIIFCINRNLTLKIILIISGLLSKIKIIKNPEETNKKIEKQLNFFLECNNSMNKNKPLIFRLYIFTFLQITSFFSIPFFIFKSFNLQGFPIFDMIATEGFVSMISSYTPLPGAAGTTEGSFILLFSYFFTGGVLYPSMILFRFITYYFGIIISFFMIKIKTKSTRKG